MNNVETITLFVQDLEESKRFYASIFDFEVAYEDEVSWVIRIGALMINLLQLSEASELVDPLVPSSDKSSPTMLLTSRVDDVDVTCTQIAKHGVVLINGPMDRPWGRRTAAFSDPDGYVWEVAHEI